RRHVERPDGGDGGGAARRGDRGRGQHRGGDRRRDRAAGAARGSRGDCPGGRPLAARPVPRVGARCRGTPVRDPSLRRPGARRGAREAVRGTPRAPDEESGVSAGNGAQRQRVLVVGLDAATFDLVLPWAESGALPTIARLLREGAHAPLRSTLPALTP